MRSTAATPSRARRPQLLAAAAGTAIALLLTACGSSSGGSGGSGGDYTIGVEAPLSGANAPTGTSVLKGFTLAIDAINAKGGVKGHKIKIEAQDDQGDSATAVTAVRTLSSKNPLIIVGGDLSAIVEAIAPVLTRLGLGLVAQGAGPSVLDPVQKNIFQIDLTSSSNAQPMVEFAKALLAKPSFRAAIGPVNTPSGTAWGTGVKSIAAKNGMTVVNNTAVSVTPTDMTTTAQKLINGQPDVILTEAPDPVLPPLVSKVRSLGYSGPIVNFSFGSATTTIRSINDPKVYVARGQAQYNPTATTAGAKEFVSLVDAAKQQTAAEGATQYSQGYMLGLVTIAALQKCGDKCTKSAVIDALSNITVDTQGFTPQALAFSDTDHVANKSVSFYTWSGGKVTPALDGKAFAGSVYSLDAS